MRGGVVVEVCGDLLGDVRGRFKLKRLRVKKPVRELLVKLAEQAGFTGG